MYCDDTTQSTLSRYFAVTKDECSSSAVTNGKTAGGCGFDFSDATTSLPIGCYSNTSSALSTCAYWGISGIDGKEDLNLFSTYIRTHSLLKTPTTSDECRLAAL